MNKVLKNKRINTFKTHFPNYKTSKNGNFFIEIGVQLQFEKTIYYCGINSTKNQLKKIGDTHKYITKGHPLIILMSPEGKMMCRTSSSKFFKNFTLKDLLKISRQFASPYYEVTTQGSISPEEFSKIKDVFFIGRKYEYLKDLDYMWPYRCMQNFNSFKEFKNFIGYTFISEKKIQSLFEKHREHDVLDALLRYDKKNIISLLTKGNDKIFDIIYDSDRMSKDLKKEFNLPSGVHKLHKLHDKLVMEINSINIEQYSNQQIYKVVPNIHDFVKTWENMGINVKALDTPRKLFIQGVKQHHCIGTYYRRLDDFAFYTLEYDTLEYDIMLKPSGEIMQFYGKRNANPPQTLKDLILTLDYGFEIKKIVPDEAIEPLKLDKLMSHSVVINGELPF